jgi:hypothetical protein
VQQVQGVDLRESAKDEGRMKGRYVLLAITDEGIEIPIYAHDDYGMVKRRLREVGDGTFSIAENSVKYMRVVNQETRPIAGTEQTKMGFLLQAGRQEA